MAPVGPDSTTRPWCMTIVVSVTCCTTARSADGVRAYQELRRKGRLPARIDVRFHSPRLLTSAGLAETGLQSGFEDSWLRLGGIKLFIDGAGHDLAHNTFVDLK
jgi:predicted amidohydrolase YtcJ